MRIIPSKLSYITIDPRIMSGRPVLKGTKITIGEMIGFLGDLEGQNTIQQFSGMKSIDSILCVGALKEFSGILNKGYLDDELSLSPA